MKKRELTEEEFDKLGKSDHDLEKEEEVNKEKLKDAYLNIIDLIKKYGDINELYPPILACWIIGTYIHKNFLSYPYLFLNAMKGSGKSRILKLIMDLSKNGQVNNNMTEAVLFRTKGTLGIDEFEGVSRKGIENLRELLNSGYKKGVKVRRVKKQKTFQGEEMTIEEFEVYRPIALANIYGMEDVLSDRTIPLILERSNKSSVVNLLEIWEFEEEFISTKKILNELFTHKKESSVVWCMSLHLSNVHSLYQDWNKYVTLTDTTTLTYNNTKQHLFTKIKETGFNGRELEITFPILLISSIIGEEYLKDVINSLTEIMKGKREDQFIESKDITFIDFIAQYPPLEEHIPLTKLAKEFKEFLQEDESEEKWINPKWIGRALKRLSLIKNARRLSRGREVILDINKAQDKIRMFK